MNGWLHDLTYPVFTRSETKVIVMCLIMISKLLSLQLLNLVQAKNTRGTACLTTIVGSLKPNVELLLCSYKIKAIFKSLVYMTL